MNQVLTFSFLLMLGMVISQVFDLAFMRPFLSAITMACLAYIMIEVGLDFLIDKTKLRSYGVDYLVAATAAAFPWILCALYFIFVFSTEWKEAFLTARFAAPTSAGVLFTMLVAAGLAATWVFKKARILAIFDDLDTVLFMIPLKMLIVGLQPQLGIILIVIVFLLWAAYRFLHMWRIPLNKWWLLFYAVLLVVICEVFYRIFDVHLEVLLPAFVLGCVIYNGNQKVEHWQHTVSKLESRLDGFIKLLFMFLVGVSLPKINFVGLDWKMLTVHVLIITIIANLGKCYPIFCYTKESSLRERIALSLAMMPRGEVGAGVLLVSIGYGITGFPLQVAALSLALNLLLTGLFIAIIIKLLKR